MAKVWKKLQRADSDYTGNVTGSVGGTSASDVKDGAVAGTAAKTVTDAAFDSNNKLNVANANDGLKNSQVTVAKDSNGNISLNNAGSGSISLDNSDVGLGNVTNDAQIKSDGSNAPNSLKNDQISLSASGGTVTLTGASSSNNSFDKGDVGLGNVDNESKASILGGTFTGDIGGTSASDIKSGAALGATANQDSTSTILGGTLTGSVANTATVGGTAASTVASGAANGTTAIGAFDTSGSTPILNVDNAAAGLKNSGISINADGTLTGAGSGQVTAAGVNAIGTDGTGAPNSLKNNQITLTASGGTVTLNNAGSGTIDKGDIGLGSVVNQAITVASGKIQFDGTAQTIDADSLGGSNLSTVKSDAVSTAETNILGGAPDALNTLDELAAALNDDASFNSTITTSIATKGPAPLSLTAEDLDGDTSFDNDPANLTEGQIGIFGGEQYVVVDVS